ncbi:DNA circularization N-terminal domain-containing protein [Humitalea sp. 24SJ18S-53]|uniref:DNA circularization N-terminal domain-containing protein n=1 Tax=Humitalea sp. 24SJ18S-53 TaxID=3422307 RepID=UPI003D676C67
MSGSLLSSATGLLRRLRPASFRGVAFVVVGSGTDLGRRVVTHKFPLRDTVQHEDMGRRERSITIEAFLVGDDAAGRLARLERALEQAGAGRLVHPTYGELQVVVTAAKTMTGLEQGLVRVSITFEVDDEASAQPRGVTNGTSLLDRLGLGAVSAFVDEYASLLTIDGLQDFVAEQLGEQLGALGLSMSDLASVYGLAGQALGVWGLLESWTASAEVSPSPSGMSVSAGAVVTSIAALGRADQVADATGAVVGAVEAWRAAGTLPNTLTASAPRPDALIALSAAGAGITAPAGVSATDSRRAAASNLAALDLLVRATAAAEAVRAGAVVAWDSRDEAASYRDRIADALDDAADRAGGLGWDASWRGLLDLRAAWVGHINSVAAPLPRVTSVMLAAPRSSVRLAYQLDGDALATLIGRAGDIATRNAASHPGFLPAGEPLEVLTDAG